MIKSKIPFISVLFLLAVGDIQAQTEDLSDNELWLSAKLNYKHNKKWNFGIEQQLRRKENYSVTDQYFTELSAKRYFFKKAYLGVAARYINDNDTKGKITGYEQHVRINADLGFKHKVNRFKFNYRIRFQGKNELNVSEAEGDTTNYTLRFKVSTLYNIKKWPLDPKVSVELFNGLGPNPEFIKYRFTAGTSYEFKKFGELCAFYRFEKGMNVPVIKTSHIIGIQYTYTLKRKK